MRLKSWKEKPTRGRRRRAELQGRSASRAPAPDPDFAAGGLVEPPASSVDLPEPLGPMDGHQFCAQEDVEEAGRREGRTAVSPWVTRDMGQAKIGGVIAAPRIVRCRRWFGSRDERRLRPGLPGGPPCGSGFACPLARAGFGVVEPAHLALRGEDQVLQDGDPGQVVLGGTGGLLAVGCLHLQARQVAQGGACRSPRAGLTTRGTSTPGW